MKKDTHIVIRTTMEERRIWKELAEREGESLSEWVRRILNRETEKGRRGRRERRGGG